MKAIFFKKYLLIFFFLGQNSVDIIGDKKSILRWCLQYVLRVLSLLISVATLSIELTRQSIQDHFREEAQKIILVTILMLSTTIGATILFENFFMPNCVHKSNEKFQNLVFFLESELNIVFDKNEFMQHFRNKLIVFLSVIFGAAFAQVFTFFSWEITFSELTSFYLVNAKHFTVAYILIWIDFLKCILISMNRQLDIVQIHMSSRLFPSNIYQFLVTLKHYKLVHYEVWKVNQFLNRRFGWVLVIIVLANFLDISYSSYWLFVYIYRLHFDASVIRNKFLSIFLF